MIIPNILIISLVDAQYFAILVMGAITLLKFKPPVAYRFEYMALYHSQTRRHVLNSKQVTVYFTCSTDLEDTGVGRLLVLRTLIDLTSGGLSVLLLLASSTPSWRRFPRLL